MERNSSAPSSNITIKMGANHHFLFVFKKSNNSLKIGFSRDDLAISEKFSFSESVIRILKFLIFVALLNLQVSACDQNCFR